MARSSNESTSDLFVRLGLSYDELESGFVNAERTIRDNMTRLHRENQIIDLQAQVEILGLDETADAERILEIRTKALNEQIEKQKDRVRLASAELQNMIDRTGENSDQTQRARLALERERLALAQLENQLNRLGETQEETNDDISSLDDLLDRIPPELKAVGGALLGVTTALLAAGAASKELIEKWCELQTTAYNLNMSVNDTENFLRHMKLAGGEIEDVMGYIRGITDAYTKGENDDPEFIALSRYGAKIVDASGRLKNFQQITEEVYQAYLKAKAAGEEIEFLQLTGGESGVTDAIQYFERYAEAKEDAAKIFDAGLDAAEMHEAERTLNRLTMQMGEFKDAAVNVITPSAVEMAEGLFEAFHAGTEVIVNNTEAIRKWGGVFVESFVSNVPLLRSIRQLMNIIAPSEKEVEETAAVPEQADKSWADYRREMEETAKAQKQSQKSWADFQRTTHEGGNPLNQYDWQRIKGYREELEDLRAEIDNFNNDYKKSLAEVALWEKRALTDPNYLSRDEKLEVLRLSRAKIEQIEQQRAQELKEIREDVAAELGSDLDQQLLDFQRQKKDWISAGMEAAEAEILAEKLKVDAIEDLEDEFSLQYNELKQNDLENQLARIEKEKEDWIDKGISEAAATAMAEAQKADVIEQLNEEAASKLGAIWNTALENRLAEIEREKQAWIDKGVEEVKATKWAEQAKADARKSAAMSVLKSQLEEYRAFQEGGYERLMNYQRNELFEAGIKPEDLYMTPETLAKFQKAQDTVERNLLPNFATDYDRAEASRLINNELVETQQMLHRAFDKLDAQDFLSGREVRAMVAMPTMDRSALPTEEELEQMYDPVNHTAEEFKNLVPQLGEASEGIKDFNGAITQFSAVEQPEPPEIPTAPESPPAEPVAVQLPEIDTSKISAAFEELALPLEEFGRQIEELTSQLIDTTSALENLASLEKPSSQETAGVESQLVDSATVERFVAQIAETADATENFKNVVAGFEIPPIDTSAINAEFAELVSPMSEVNTRFAGMSANLADVTNGLAELSRALNQFSVPQQNQTASQQTQSAPPVNVINNMSIEEAHAWDSKHIQELADKVAAVIEPALVRAIGGDSNRY